MSIQALSIARDPERAAEALDADFERQCFIMKGWTVTQLQKRTPRHLEDRLVEILDQIALAIVERSA